MKFISLPNQLTALRILLTPVFVVFFLASDLYLTQLSLLVFTLAALTDWYDGWVARRWGYVTRWGAFLDPLADKVLTSAAFFAFLSLHLVPTWTVWVIIVRDITITLLRSYSEYKGKPIDTSSLAKTKTFTQFVVIYYLLILVIGKETPQIYEQFKSIVDILLTPELVDGIMIFTSLLTLYTGILYLITNWSTIRELYATTIVNTENSTSDITHRPHWSIILIASTFFAGYAPISGTVSSFVALLLYAIPGFEKPTIILPIVLFTFCAGIPIAGIMEKHYGSDPKEVTIDETVGMWTSLLFLPKTIWIGLAAFFIFRFFDIIKPFPAHIFDRRQGGFAIMIDDVICGLYANVSLQIMLQISVINQFLQ